MAEVNSESSHPPTKESKRSSHFNAKWIEEFPGVGKNLKGIPVA